MIPAYTSAGLLPKGVHWATWLEIVSRFGHNDYRTELLLGMQIGLHSLKTAGCQSVFIDGSFVTNKEYPGDFDICYDDSDIDWDILKAFDPTILSMANKRAAQKAKYRGEFFPANYRAVTLSTVTFFEFFQIDKHTGNDKGIVGLNLIAP